MMKTQIFLILFLLLVISGYSQQFGKNFIDENYIEVTGKAEMKIMPDEIYLKIIISEKDNKGKQTLEELEKLMIDKLRILNVDIEKNLKVHDISSNFKNYWLGRTDIFTTKNIKCWLTMPQLPERYSERLNLPTFQISPSTGYLILK